MTSNNPYNYNPAPTDPLLSQPAPPSYPQAYPSPHQAPNGYAPNGYAPAQPQAYIASPPPPQAYAVISQPQAVTVTMSPMPVQWLPGMPMPVINCPCGFRGQAVMEKHLLKEKCCWSCIAGIFIPILGCIMCCFLQDYVPVCPNCKRIHAMGEYTC